MKRSFIFIPYCWLMALTIPFVAGCKKSVADKLPEPLPLIKSVTITTNGGTPVTNNYVYENGKAKTTSYANGNTANWRHFPDSVVQTGVNASGQFLYKAVGVLNGKGFVQTNTQYDANGNITYNEIESYDGDNHRIKSTITTLPYSAVYNTYLTGNRVDSFVYEVNGKAFFRSITLETAADITNTIGNANYGIPFSGVSAQLVKKLVKYNYNSSGVLLETIQTSFDFQVNAKGQISRETETSVSSLFGTSTVQYEFTYY